jgi:hypothetical protein
VAAVSKLSRASTSVLTRPGTTCRISRPKRTSTASTTSSSGRRASPPRFGQQRRVLGLLHRLQDERRVGGGVLRRELRQLAEVAGVGHHGGEGLESIELVHARAPRLPDPTTPP